MKTRLSFTGLSALVSIGIFVLAVACGGPTDDSGRGKLDTPRGLGKADGTMSCKNTCGQQAIGGCWCDDKCATYGDCCSDKAAECDGGGGGGDGGGGNTPACEGFCGKKSPQGCWCDAKCAQYGDCCPAKKETCDSPSKKCNGNSDCLSGEFCAFKDGDCTLQTLVPIVGVCKKRPQACIEIYSPVCGCDGKTYGNSCKASEAGTSVGSQGKCAPAPGSCTQDSDCSDGFCGCKDMSCTQKTCKKWSEEGESCGGFVPANYVKRCRPGLKCDMSTLIPDAPGKCVKDGCAGAWLDQNGNCRGPADGVLADKCCAEQRFTKCQKINGDYGKAVSAAKKCYPWSFAPQCLTKVTSSLTCGCPTYINGSPAPLKKHSDAWAKAQCYKVGWMCPAVMCPNLTGATCTTGGSCKDTSN